ncbi:Uncharacterized protein FWK35_00029947 [Aphis craccivora]|uniref:Uncharacterized protein n=1 Tax=Aphis craccivora TaxID=307492 RepID=A0A6G0W2L1_APHCR|nr:Uncharacterized protein FWK35_00029947 [Aphis craccivora]
MATPPPEYAAVLHTEVQLMDLIFLITVFLALVVYIGFYTIIYKQSDCVRRLERKPVTAHGITNGTCGQRRWFQPFCYFNNADDPTTEWIGDWVSVCTIASDISSEEEITN